MKKTKCVCGEVIQYKASDIKRKEVAGSQKDITGGNISKFIQVIKCEKCNNLIEVYHKLDITGGFMD